MCSISRDTIKRANRHVIASPIGKGESISKDGIVVSASYRGRTSSQTIDISTIRSNYSRALNSVRL